MKLINRLHLLLKRAFLSKAFQTKTRPQEKLLVGLLKKYSSHVLILLGLVVIALISEILPLAFKEKQQPLSLDSLVPEDFVLMPIELSNGMDIVNIIGPYGVVDLYAYSAQTERPENQVARAIKIIPPDIEGGRFAALVPEDEAGYLFKYSGPFYAVIQNPKKKNSKVYKKKEKSAFIIEEFL